MFSDDVPDGCYDDGSDNQDPEVSDCVIVDVKRCYYPSLVSVLR